VSHHCPSPPRVPDAAPADRHGELGGALGSWLVQLLVVLAVLGLLGYEAVAVGVTAFRVDDASRQVAREARDAYRSSNGSLQTATTAAAEAAVVHDASLVDVAQDGEELVVTLQRQAPTLFVHRIGPLGEVTERSATARAGLGAL
jgi:hypothetical protein